MTKNNLKLVAMGSVVGLINGFMGGGGGIFVVIALTMMIGLAQKNAHATAILIILPVSIASVIIYIIGGNVDWIVTLYATVGVVFGGIFGAFLLKKSDDKWLKFIFSFILIFSGIRMFF